MTRLLPLGLLALLLMGCPLWPTQEVPEEHAVEAPLGQPFELAVGRAAIFAGTSLTLYFQEVPEDSRCPTDAMCVWGGRGLVRLHATVENLRGGQDFTLDVMDSDERTYAYVGYRILLLDLTPYPVSTTPIDPDAYSARLLVERQ